MVSSVIEIMIIVLAGGLQLSKDIARLVVMTRSSDVAICMGSWLARKGKVIRLEVSVRHVTLDNAEASLVRRGLAITFTVSVSRISASS